MIARSALIARSSSRLRTVLINLKIERARNAEQCWRDCAADHVVRSRGQVAGESTLALESSKMRDAMPPAILIPPRAPKVNVTLPATAPSSA